ncbi:MAG: hypothetical protein AAGA78_06930 [Pseudomonadota bacterium]
MLVRFLSVVLFWGCAVASLAEPVTRIEVILERNERSVEIFVGLPAEAMVSAFGLPPQTFENDAGVVEFSTLREGTFETGDVFFAGLEMSLAGQTVPLEAMSMMVHPEDAKLEFNTPWDGLIAIAVCTVEEPEVPVGLSGLYAYAGAIAYLDGATGQIELSLPHLAEAGYELHVRDFTHGVGQASTQYVLQPGETIIVPSRETGVLSASVLSAVALALAMIGLVWVRVKR